MSADEVIIVERKPRVGRWLMRAASRVPVDMPETRALTVLVGQRVRIRRESLGISVAELAAVIGGDPRKIDRWENGCHLPSLHTLLAVSLALDCSIGDLIPSDVRGVRIILKDGDESARERRIAEIEAAMRRTNGSIVRAAELLGIKQNTLSHHLARLGLSGRWGRQRKR